MDIKTENQYRTECRQVWSMLENEREFYSWKPIKTAPKTGKEVIIFCDDTKEMMVAFWNKKLKGWQFAIDPYSGAHIARPTLWTNTPPPPPTGAGEL